MNLCELRIDTNCFYLFIYLFYITPFPEYNTYFSYLTYNKTYKQKEKKTSESPGFFSKLFGSKKKDNALAVVKRSSSTARMVKPRAAPIKIEPKVFFANERTFLAWMHISVILAGASVAILALSDYDDIGKQLYGLIMLPVAIAFLVYSMFQCKYY